MHSVFLEYDLRTASLGGSIRHGVSNNAGVAVSYELYVDGERVGARVVGWGKEMPCPVDRIESVSYKVRHTLSGGDYRTKGSMIVARIRPRPTGTELSFKGIVHPNTFTEVIGLKVYRRVVGSTSSVEEG